MSDDRLLLPSSRDIAKGLLKAKKAGLKLQLHLLGKSATEVARFRKILVLRRDKFYKWLTGYAIEMGIVSIL